MTEDEALRKEAETRKEVDLRAESLRTQNIYDFSTGFQTFGLRGEEKDRLEKEIASKVGSHIGYSDDEIKEVTVSAEERIKSEWRRRKEDYLENGNEDRLVVEENSPYDGSEYTNQLARQGLAIEQYGLLAGKEALAKEIFASKDEQTEFPVKAGEKETYGFNKEKMFEIMLKNCQLPKSDQKSVSDLPKPTLKKLSFAEKIKKRFTGKSKTDDENRKIMQQYDAFVKNVDKLLENYNPTYIERDKLNSLDDLAKFGDYKRLRDSEIVSYNRGMSLYIKAKIENDRYNVAARRFNENNKENVSQVKAERQQILEQRKVEGAQQKVDEMSNPQFRDTEVRKTDDEKTKEAQDRYLARKILKDRGLLKVSSVPSKAGGATQTKVNVAAVAAAKQVTH